MTKRIVVDTPDELHAEFKAAAARHGVSMKDLILAFVEGWLAEQADPGKHVPPKKGD